MADSVSFVGAFRSVLAGVLLLWFGALDAKAQQYWDGAQTTYSDAVSKANTAYSQEIREINDSDNTTDPQVKKRIEETGSLIVGNTPAEFASQIAAEFEVYKKVVVLQKLKLD